jgi:hypothetical protein
MQRGRLTNKKIISVLFPILCRAIEGEIPEGKVGEFGDIGWIEVERIDEGETVCSIGATLHFYGGKYGRATLFTKLRKSDNAPVVDWLGYEKTFRGTMNGFFATVDWSGRILDSEWD